MDWVVKTTYPDDEVVTTTYNAQGLPLTLEGDALYVGSAAYNALGQVKELGFGSGVISTTHLYDGEETQDPGDDSFRLKQTRTFSDSTMHLQLEYTYDDVGNVASIIDVTKGNQLQTFTYDALDRLQPLVAQKLLNGGHPAAGVHGAWSLPTGAGPLGIWRRRGSSSLPGTCGDHPIECRAFSFIPHPPTARPERVARNGSIG
jgi:YD repeat-containing protein